MRLLLFLYFIGFTSSFFAQESSKDTIENVLSENIYIEDHKEQFNVKLEISNDIVRYKFPQEKVELQIKPNLKMKYAFVLSYKFASVRLGIRPKVSDEDKLNKGETNSFRIHFKLLFDNWSHYFEYNYDKGYYIVNTEDFVPSIPKSDFRIQFPDLTTNTFSGSSTYKFNENYSVRAIESQTEIQVQSAGSFMPGIFYSYYNIKGMDKVLFPEDHIILRDYYSNIEGFNVTLNAGYYYTFVYRKYWFANAYITPGLGMDFFKMEKHTPVEVFEKNYSDLFYYLKGGLGLGYNGKKVFFGANYAHRISSEKYIEDNIRLHTSKNSFHVYLGYRFKAPKAVRKSVDYVEEKIPILNKDLKDKD